MMKRICIPLIVLVSASTAGAALQISIEGEDYYEGQPPFVVWPNVPLQLGIWTDSEISYGNGEWNGWALVTDDSIFTMLGGISLFPGEPGITIWDGVTTIGLPEIPGQDGVAGTLSITGSPIPADSTIFDNINLVWDKAGFDIVVPIYLYGSMDYMNYTLLDTALVFPAPEPMTIGLLGLGAVFLRRKNEIIM